MCAIVCDMIGCMVRVTLSYIEHISYNFFPIFWFSVIL